MRSLCSFAVWHAEMHIGDDKSAHAYLRLLSSGVHGQVGGFFGSEVTHEMDGVEENVECVNPNDEGMTRLE
jgi:hypothetical protein